MERYNVRQPESSRSEQRLDMAHLERIIHRSFAETIQAIHGNLEQMIRVTVRESISESIQGLDPLGADLARRGSSKPAQIAESKQLENFGQQMHLEFKEIAQRTLDDYSKLLVAQEKKHAEALATMLRKTTQLTDLVRSLRDPVLHAAAYSIQACAMTPRGDEDARTPKGKSAEIIGMPVSKGDSDEIVAMPVSNGNGSAVQESKEKALENHVSLTSPKKSLTLNGDEEDKRSWGEIAVSSGPFEMTFAALILLNTLNMCVEAEYRGWGMGNTLGIEGMHTTTERADDVFEVIELSFGIAFTAEIVLKFIALRFDYWRSAWNIFDFIVVGLSWFSLAFRIDFVFNPLMLRLVRLVRLLRLARGLSAFEFFDNLHLMVRGIKGAIPVVIWVVVLIFPMIACCALGLNYILLDFMEDGTKPLKDRLDCYEYFGTFSKATLSMFEVTFGNWVPICRFLYNTVNSQFAIFFMAYQLLMGIAVLRIVYGVFLHVTLTCASNDDETVIAKKKRENKKYADKMHSLFTRFDNSNDGYLTRDEFREIVQDDRVKTLLSAMELDIEDAELVFDLADDGDNKMSANEMVSSFSRLKGTARSIDIWALMNLTRKAVEKIEAQVDKLDSKLAILDTAVMGSGETKRRNM